MSFIGVTLVLYRSDIFDVIILDWGIIPCSYFGQSLMYISVEPLIEHIKNVFKIDQLPVEYQKASGMFIVYYNCKTHKQHLSAIKQMLGSYIVQ